MPTMVSFTAGTPILSADVNANFAALAPAMVCLYSTYAVGTTVGTTATDLKSFSMAANTLTATGSGLLVRAKGHFSGDAFNKSIQFHCGGAIAYLNLTTPAPNDKDISIDLWVTRYSSTSCYIKGLTVLSANLASTSPTLEGAGLFNASFTTAGAFSGALTVRIVGQCVNAASSVECNEMSVWAFNAP